jgi:hypothetical protein
LREVLLHRGAATEPGVTLELSVDVFVFALRDESTEGVAIGPAVNGGGHVTNDAGSHGI